MTTIIIAVDLGHFKAYKVGKTKIGNSKMQLIESYDSIEAHGKLLDRITDQAGRFRMGGVKGGTTKAKGYGEPHNMKLEEEKRLIKLIAKDINTIIGREECEAWCFAAPAELNNRIIENLLPDVKAKLGKNVTCNLTRSKKLEILGQFDMCQPQPA
jgi:Protein required for attachment to host cells